MKTSTLTSKALETSIHTENPEYISILAVADSETVRVVFETMNTPNIAAAIIDTGQQAFKRLPVAQCALCRGALWIQCGGRTLGQGRCA